MLKFSLPLPEEKEILLNLCKDSIRGTEAYTFLSVCPGEFTDFFRCGRDEKNEIKSLVFNNGNEDIRVFGEEFSDLFFFFGEHYIMVYEGDMPSYESLTEIKGRELLDFYRLISEKDILSFDDERRYVMRLKAVNCNMARVFGIYEDEKLISCSAVTSINDKYALIGDVFTRKSHRNKGFASLCVNKAVSYILSEKRIPVLFCNGEMCSYYKRSGFTVYGKV